MQNAKRKMQMQNSAIRMRGLVDDPTSLRHLPNLNFQPNQIPFRSSFLITALPPNLPGSLCSAPHSSRRPGLLASLLLMATLARLKNDPSTSSFILSISVSVSFCTRASQLYPIFVLFALRLHTSHICSIHPSVFVSFLARL